MATVSHTVTADDGITPVPDVECRVEMPHLAIVTATGAQLLDDVWATSDSNGVVTFTLTPNSLLSPAGTWYEFTTPYIGKPQPLKFVVRDLVSGQQLTDDLAEDLPTPGPIKVGLTSAEVLELLAGLGLGAARVEFVQSTPAGQWTISHDLGIKPTVTLLLPNGEVFDADIVLPDNSTVIVVHGTPIAGTAILT
jgi:hypothetical protein